MQLPRGCWQQSSIQAHSLKRTLQARLQNQAGLRQCRLQVRQGTFLSSCLSGTLPPGRGRRKTTSELLIVYCCTTHRMSE